MNAARQLFSDPRAFGTALAALLTGRFGTDWLDWEPETVGMEIADEFGVTDVPEENFDKIFAVGTLLKTDQFYKSVAAFHHVAGALNSTASFDLFDPLDPEELAWALYEALLHEPPGRDENVADRFSPNVKAYVSASLEAAGVTGFVDIFRAVGRAASTQTSFSDDPVMYAALRAKEESDAAAVRDELKERQGSLLAQLKLVQEFLSTPQALPPLARA